MNTRIDLMIGQTMWQLYYNSVFNHYQKCWSSQPGVFLWDKGPMEKLPFDFRVLEFPPFESREMWTYATCGMSGSDQVDPIELHIFSLERDAGIIELLTAVTYYHRNSANLNLNHTINFGRPWKKASNCEYGLISLPYLDGPSLENLQFGDRTIKFYWLIPITKREVEYKKKNGLEALEEKLENASFNYLDSARESVI